MTQVINFRNAKYQGQLLNGLPDGLGITIDYKNIFCMAQWKQGVIQGKCLVVFGDSKIFCGQIKNKTPISICTYHLKDKCQVFCNFQNNDTPKKPLVKGQQLALNNKLVALLPNFNMIIKVEGQNEQQLEIKSEQVYRQNDFQALKGTLQTMLNWKFHQGQLQSFLSLENFIRENFANNPEYADLLDIVQVSTQQGAKQMFLTLKTRTGQPSLGIKIQNCMENTTTMTNLHNDGNSYIVKCLGYFTKEGILDYGLKNIKTLIKGNVKQQAIYSQQKTIIRYENESTRPKQCSINILNHLKKSPNYTNDYLQIRHLSLLQSECLNINFNIKQTETKKYAQLILQNPKDLSMFERQKIQQTRQRKLHNGSIQKNTSNDISSSIYKKQMQEHSHKNQQLAKVKQEIYRSVSKKKINGKSVSPFVHGGTNLSSSPQKDIRPAELTNIKPILEIYKNTADKSFYNSINKNQPAKINGKHIDGYKFQLPKNVDPTHQTKTFKSNYSLNSKQQSTADNKDYFKNLQSRRRLYEQVHPSEKEMRKPTVVGQTYNNPTPKKKFSYLPQDEPSQKLQASNSRRNIPNPKSYELAYQQRSRLNQNGYNEPQPSIYDPHSHYHNHSTPNQNYFRSHKLSSSINRSPEKYDNQAGKLGKRTYPKQPSNNSSSQSPHLSSTQKRSSPFDAIIVPQLRINNTKITNQQKQPLQDQTNYNPRRQHNFKMSEERKSPLKSEQYRKELENSPIRKLGNQRNVPEKYRDQYDVIMDPSVNFAKQDLSNSYLNHRKNRNYNQSNPSLTQKQHDRSRSPLPKRKRILNENPFDS